MKYTNKTFQHLAAALLITFAPQSWAYADNPKEIMRLEAAVKKGDTDAMTKLGELYREGYEVDKDIHKAHSYYQMAYEQGSLPALIALAEMYAMEYGLENERKAAEMYAGAAEKSADEQMKAKYAFAAGLYFNSTNNYSDAVKWLKKSIEYGSNEASVPLNIGYIYLNGDLGQPDLKEAFKWFQAAADMGDSIGQLMIGRYFEEGKVFERDYKKAFHWYQKSAEQKNKAAYSALASLYEHGKGVEQDLEKSCDYKRKADKRKKSAVEQTKVSGPCLTELFSVGLNVATQDSLRAAIVDAGATEYSDMVREAWGVYSTAREIIQMYDTWDILEGSLHLTVYYTADGKFARAEYDFEIMRIEELVKGLTSKYGQPDTVKESVYTSDSPALSVKDYSWKRYDGINISLNTLESGDTILSYRHPSNMARIEQDKIDFEKVRNAKIDERIRKEEAAREARYKASDAL